MILNKTVFLMNGDTKVCEYETEDVKLPELWTTIFSLTLVVDLFAVIGNTIVGKVDIAYQKEQCKNNAGCKNLKFR